MKRTASVVVALALFFTALPARAEQVVGLKTRPDAS